MRFAHPRLRGLVAALAGVLFFGTVSRLQAGDSSSVHQQLAKVRQDFLAAASKPGDEAKTGESPDFGVTDETAVEVQSYAFQPGISTDLVLDDGSGYRYYGAVTADPYLGAPVQIPTGVVIDFLKFSGKEVNAGDMVLGLYDNGVSGDPNALIGTLTPNAVNEYFNDSASLNYTYTQTAHHPLYFVVFFANNPLDGTVKFNNAQIYYHRIVSPAPATATFNDVPTSHPFFQYIEALSASGITGGCQVSPPLYCPDAPLTRGQMAVFLAKALGLHWPF